jgi:hypothetical protein
MGYCTAADIQKDFPGVVFNATSKVKLSDIDDFIVDADNLINTYAAGKYAIPINGPISLGIVKFYSRSLVADKIATILQIKQGTNQMANQNVRSGLSTKDIIKLLEKLPTEDSLLIDADPSLDGGGINTFNRKNAVKPEFEKSVRRW